MHSYKGYKKSKLGNFPIANVIFSTMLALVVIGLFGLLLIHAHKLTQKIQEHVTVQVYLNKKITEHDIIRLDQSLCKEPFVLRKDEIAQVVFVSKKEAAETFIRETGENFIEILQENPLRDSFILYIDARYQATEQLQAIKQQLTNMSGVFEVCYVENLVLTINKNVRQASLVFIFLASILLVAVVILIRNTIKLALYSQRFLIRSMNLVGATAIFIRRPFLVRAVLIGLLAGMMADIFLLMLLYYANLQIDVLASLQEPATIFTFLGVIPVLGASITFMATYQTINKYLYVSLENLH